MNYLIYINNISGDFQEQVNMFYQYVFRVKGFTLNIKFYFLKAFL